MAPNTRLLICRLAFQLINCWITVNSSKTQKRAIYVPKRLPSTLGSNHNQARSRSSSEFFKGGGVEWKSGYPCTLAYVACTLACYGGGGKIFTEFRVYELRKITNTNSQPFQYGWLPLVCVWKRQQLFKIYNIIWMYALHLKSKTIHVLIKNPQLEFRLPFPNCVVFSVSRFWIFLNVLLIWGVTTLSDVHF